MVHLPSPAYDSTAAPGLTPEITAIVSDLREFFRTRSVPAFLVGGYIRDALRGESTHDVDVAVHGASGSVARSLADALGGAYVPLTHPSEALPPRPGVRSVARVVLPSRERRHEPCVVDISSIDGSIQEDLGGRDFTVDAMALDIDDWLKPGWRELVIDPLGGKRDLADQNIRAIQMSVFEEDPARLLRAVRLAAALGFRIEPTTADAIKDQAHLINSIAGERVRDELLSILSLDGAKDHLEMLDHLGLLCCIIPEFDVTKGVEQPKEHYWDVFWHSLCAVEGVERVVTGPKGDEVSNLVPWNEEIKERFSQWVGDGHTRGTMLKLAALLHDVAKPQTKTTDANGKTRFLGHHTLGASMSGGILRRLRLSSRGRDMIYGVVENHLRPTQMSQGSELPTSRAIYRYFRDVGDAAVDTLYMSLADHLAARGPKLDMGAWSRHAEIISHVLEVGTHTQSPEKFPRLIDGNDLMRELGLGPGPQIGALLEEIREAQAAREVQTWDEALNLARSGLAGLDSPHPSGRGEKGSNPVESGR